MLLPEDPVADGAVLIDDPGLVGDFCQRLIGIGIGVEIVAMVDSHFLPQADDLIGAMAVFSGVLFVLFYR